MNADSTGALSATSIPSRFFGLGSDAAPDPENDRARSSDVLSNRWSAASSCCDLDVKSMRPPLRAGSEPLEPWEWDGEDILYPYCMYVWFVKTGFDGVRRIGLPGGEGRK